MVVRTVVLIGNAGPSITQEIINNITSNLNAAQSDWHQMLLATHAHINIKGLFHS